VASSAIEGLHAPLAEVAAAELDDSAVETASAWVADNLAAVTHALTTASASPLSVDLLHSWHRRLMRHGSLDASMVGAFRQAQGWIGGTSPLDATYVPPPPTDVPELMDDLVAFANGDAHDAVIQAGAVHAQFETIHPYGDGNGRLGRILVGWILCRRTGIAVPPPLSVLIARDAGGYLSGLYEFRTGEVDRYLAWFATVLCRSAEATTAVMESLGELISTWRARLSGLRADALARRLLDLLPAHPVISSTVVVQETNVSERTARRALTELAERDILRPFAPAHRPPGRPHHWWVAAELLDAIGGWAG
jgi:Fic family protein